MCRRAFRHAFGAALALLAGCTVGPDFHQPAAPKAAGYTEAPLAKKTASAAAPAGAAQRFVPGLDIPGKWWRLFHSNSLDRLVKEALAANPTVAAARSALRRRQEKVYAAAGAAYPSISADFSASRSKTAASQSPVPANGELYYSLYTPEVTGLLRTRRVRRHQTRGRLARGKGRSKALRARSHVFEPQLERRRGGDRRGSAGRRVRRP